MPKLDPADQSASTPTSPPSFGGFNTTPASAPTSSFGGGFGSTTNVQVTQASTTVDPNTTAAFGEALDASAGKPEEHWMKSFWRPAMGWLYMLVCFMDFIGFPVLWSLLQAMFHGQVTSQWNPLTLQGAGLFHLAMGAILGVAAYGRSKEKTNGTN